MYFSRWSNRCIALLAIFGFAVASYLVYAHHGWIPLACDIPLFDCGKVAEHPLAFGFGIRALSRIPTAAFGSLFFAILGGLCVLRALGGSAKGERLLALAQFGLVGVAVVGILLLAFAEMFVIHAWCLWCVITALIIISILLILLSDRRRANRHTPPMVSERHIGEAAGIAAIEIVGIVATIFLLQYVRHYMASPRFDAHLSKANLLITDCHIIGDAKAPYTLAQFGSYGCGHCKASVGEVQKLLQEYHGKLNFVFSPAMRQPDNDFILLSCAAEAAALQGKYWQMHLALFAQQDALYNRGGRPLQPLLDKQAQLLGLARTKFAHDLLDTAIVRRVKQHMQVAKRYHMSPIPKYVFYSPGHPPVLLLSTMQMVKWLHTPQHWQ